jgi:pimeloyl-ACP methyl ester carboxylesterase
MPPATTDHGPLTVVLVHGAFADSSSWNGVIERLQAAGIQVTAAPNPLRGISHDSAYVASFHKQVPGPVLAVGHSYGGAVISNAATGLGNVVGRSRCSIRLRTARGPPPSSRSIPPSSTTSSPPTCRPPRPR